MGQNAIVYAGSAGDASELFSFDIQGDARRQLTSLSRDVGFPEWSPDGSQILLTVRENDAFVLKLIDLASGEVTHVGEGAAPTWR